jgi:hypothetical protein
VRLLVVVLPILVVAAILMFLVLRRPATPTSPAAEHRRRAVIAKARFHRVVDHTRSGPLRDRLQALGTSVDEAAAEALRVADIVDAVDAQSEGAPLRRLDRLVTTLERAVITAGELAVAGADETGRLAAELDSLQAAFRELGPGA